MARKTRAEGRNDVRHTITLVPVQTGSMVFHKAVCSCNRFESPAFWAKERAEDLGNLHLLGLGNNGRRGE